MITTCGNIYSDPDLTCAAVLQLLYGEVPYSIAHELGVFLEIKPAVVKDLTFNPKNPQDMMIAVINHWLEFGKDRSWSKLAEAVESCGYKVFANTITSKHAMGVLDSKSDRTCELIMTFKFLVCHCSYMK